LSVRAKGINPLRGLTITGNPVKTAKAIKVVSKIALQIRATVRTSHHRGRALHRP
jgi:hypothetical protein